MDNRGITQINFDCFTIDESNQVKIFSEIMRCQGYFFSKKKGALGTSLENIFMFNRYVQQVRLTDSSHLDDNLYFTLVDNFVHKDLFIQFVQS